MRAGRAPIRCRRPPLRAHVVARVLHVLLQLGRDPLASPAAQLAERGRDTLAREPLGLLMPSPVLAPQLFAVSCTGAARGPGTLANSWSSRPVMDTECDLDEAGSGSALSSTGRAAPGTDCSSAPGHRFPQHTRQPCVVLAQHLTMNLPAATTLR